MSKVDLGEALLAQMGGQVWKERLARPKPILPVLEDDPRVEQKENVHIVSPAQASAHTVSSSTAFQKTTLPFVLIASGLEAIWENDEAAEWRLLQNIAKTFQWDLEALPYFDTDLIATEEAVMATLEEVFALNVGSVLSMGEDSLLSEHFSEGLEVISLSSLETMLEDTYAKKMAYVTLLNQVNA